MTRVPTAKPAAAAQKNAATERGGRAHARALALSEYFSSVSELARALATTRDTVRAWMASPPGKPRDDLLQRADRLWLLVRSAERYVDGRHKIGEWSLSPHIGLSGESPAAFVAAGGDDGLRRMLDDMARYTPSRPDLPLEADEATIWEGVQAILGAEAAAQLATMLEAPELALTDEDKEAMTAFDDVVLDDETGELIEPEPVRAPKRRVPADDGWEVVRSGSSGRSTTHRNQRDAELAARVILNKGDGKDRIIRARDGSIQAGDTGAPRKRAKGST